MPQQSSDRLIVCGSGPDETTMFDSLDLPPPRFADAIVTFDQARELFLAAMEYIRKAKEYFVLDGFVTEHLDLLSDESNLYRYLIPFEQDPERKMCVLSVLPRSGPFLTAFHLYLFPSRL